MKTKVCRETIIQLRIDKGWSQETLAEKTGVHTRTIQRIEKKGVASIRSLESLATALAVHSSVLSNPAPSLANPGQSLAHSDRRPESHKQIWKSFKQRQQARELAKQVEKLEHFSSYHWLGWALFSIGGFLLVEVLLMTQANLSRTLMFKVFFPGISIGLLLMLAGQFIVTLSTKAANELTALRILLRKATGKAEFKFRFQRRNGNFTNTAPGRGNFN